MDFEPRYTEEQERFRQEVRAWLKDNVPDGIVHPADPIDLTSEQYQLRRGLGRKLGAKGWLWPTAPAEFGGGGLDVDHAVVIEEEIDAYGLTNPPYYDSGGRLGRRIHPGLGLPRAERGLPAPYLDWRCPYLAASCRNRKPGPTWPTSRPPPSATATSML